MNYLYDLVTSAHYFPRICYACESLMRNESSSALNVMFLFRGLIIIYRMTILLPGFSGEDAE